MKWASRSPISLRNQVSSPPGDDDNDDDSRASRHLHLHDNGTRIAPGRTIGPCLRIRRLGFESLRAHPLAPPGNHCGLPALSRRGWVTGRRVSGFTSHRADPASQWAASSAPFDDRCGSGCGVAGDNGVPGGVDGEGVGSPSAEITVCAPVLVSMAITVLSSGWPRRRFRHRRPPPDRSAFFQPGLW